MSEHEHRTLSDVERSVTRKALYPRCATCKHYQPEENSDSGECSEMTREDGRPWFTSIGAYGNDSAILVSSDFGCVLHEEKT